MYLACPQSTQIFTDLSIKIKQSVKICGQNKRLCAWLVHKLQRFSQICYQNKTICENLCNLWTFNLC